MSKILSGAFALIVLVNLSTSKTVPEFANHPQGQSNREGRWFGYRYTSTEIIPKMVTSLIPSSCVQIEPSLPPCRNVRNLEEFPRFLGGYTREDVNHEVIPTIHTTPLGWGEYLGIYAPTVTVTAMEMHTTTVLDPRTVVTFSVKGCKPSRLPMDLNLCPSQVPPVLDIKPTNTVAEATVTTTTLAMGTYHKPDLDHAPAMDVPNDLDHIQPAGQLIAVHPNNQIQTEPLPL